MVNAESTFQSELARAEGWKQQYGDNYAETPLLLPPAAQQFVLSSQLDLATMSPVWEAAAMTLNEDFPMPSVARRVGGEQEQLGSVQAVATKENAYVLKFDPAVFGVMLPANRQKASRWAREAVFSKQAKLSPYLTKIAAFPDKVGTEIIMAIDLTDAISQSAIKKAMEASQTIGASDVD
ncbi:unnamed protein product, partial [Ectocarpus sp. 4 AP-2014]